MKKQKRRFPKINTIAYGGRWIAGGLLIGGAVPAFVWLAFHVFLWIACLAGGIILASFFILLAIEWRQDNGKIPYEEKSLKDTIPFDPKKQYAVIRASICTGEMVAGFKARSDGRFTEALLVRTPEDIERFKRIYGITDIKKEY